MCCQRVRTICEPNGGKKKDLLLEVDLVVWCFGMVSHLQTTRVGIDLKACVHVCNAVGEKRLSCSTNQRMPEVLHCGHYVAKRRSRRCDSPSPVLEVRERKMVCLRVWDTDDKSVCSFELLTKKELREPEAQLTAQLAIGAYVRRSQEARRDTHTHTLLTQCP